MYNDNDYRDYLQHEGRAHKYILKIGKGAQARYFYTQQEIEAFRNKATKKAKGMAIDAGAALYDRTKAGKINSPENRRKLGWKPLTKKEKARGLIENARTDAGITVDVAKEKGRKIARSAKKKAKAIEKETRPTRKKLARTVKREAGEFQRDATYFTKKAKRNIKKSIGTAKKTAKELHPYTQGRRMREKYGPLGDVIENKAKKAKRNAKKSISATKRKVNQKINEREDKLNRKYTTEQIDPNKKNTYYVNRKSVDLNTFIKKQRNTDGSYRTLAGDNYKNHYVSTRKHDAKQREKAWKKRNKEIVKASKKQKRTERKRKVKKIVNSVLRRG